MSYTLIGSLTSPFVRRVRMLMEGIPFELKELNIYETEDGLQLNKINPVNQIPVLLDGEKKIWDSRVIFNYLNQKHKFQNRDWDFENNLTAIDGAMNAGVSLFQLKRSGININEQYMVISRYRDRMNSVLDYFKPYLETEGLTEWNFLTMSIYSFLDWGTYREMINIANRPECKKFMETHAAREIVKRTQIPKV